MVGGGDSCQKVGLRMKRVAKPSARNVSMSWTGSVPTVLLLLSAVKGGQAGLLLRHLSAIIC